MATSVRIVKRGDPLNYQERRVLQRVARGMTNSDIGVALDLSEHTIKTHMRRLLKKLGGRDRAHAVALGIQSGVLPCPCSNCTAPPVGLRAQFADELRDHVREEIHLGVLVDDLISLLTRYQQVVEDGAS
jgi:DNA-binding CsgD family transcriptional regulator